MKAFIRSAIFPFFLMTIMFIVKLMEDTFDIDGLYRLGIKPHDVEGLIGIVTMPFIHADWSHLTNNLISFAILSVVLFYCYSPIGFRVFFTIYLLTGVMLWFVARPSWHIGASGLIYGMAAFLFVSGIIRNYIPLMAISMLVVFLYGGLVWGLIPWNDFVQYSWEGHTWGSIAGIFAAIIFRNQGPKKQVIVEEEDDDEEDDVEKETDGVEDGERNEKQNEGVGQN